MGFGVRVFEGRRAVLRNQGLTTAHAAPLHKNNLDNAIGAVYSGEDAIRTIIDWVEAQSNWDESALIVTADHGHYLVLDDPAALLPTRAPKAD